MVDSYSMNEEPLTEEEGQTILDSFGDSYDPEVEWRPLKVAD